MGALGETAVAFVTGASRGIGRAAAVELARSGFDVVVTARTRRDGEGRDDSDTGKGLLELPGSVTSTAAAVESEGARALPIVLDMSDRSAIDKAVDEVLAIWGRIDVLVNNAIHMGGTLTPMSELDPAVLEQTFLVNAVNPVYLVQRCLPGMLVRGSGTIINVSSSASLVDPPGPAGSGGWGVTYGMSKAALNRMAGVIKVELGSRGIKAFTLCVSAMTERARLTRRLANLPESSGSPAVPAAAIAWLARGGDDADRLNGETLHDHELLLDHELVEGKWDPAG